MQRSPAGVEAEPLALFAAVAVALRACREYPRLAGRGLRSVGSDGALRPHTRTSGRQTRRRTLLARGIPRPPVFYAERRASKSTSAFAWQGRSAHRLAECCIARQGALC
jgi:hypothetical protein